MRQSVASALGVVALGLLSSVASADNPVISDAFTADPAAIEYNGRVYLYAGIDESPVGAEYYTMSKWGVYSSSDMENWTNHGTPLTVDSFAWANADAWAAQVIERNGTFYWYVCTNETATGEKSIGVAVSSSPTGPFYDPLGAPLVSSSATPNSSSAWEDIDPTVFIDDDGQAYLYWGNTALYYVALNSDMVSLAGSIQSVPITTASFGFGFTEAPYVYKRNGIYYMLYASGWPEFIAYSTASSPHGPWVYGGVLQDVLPSSNTIHPAAIDFNGNSYLITHNGALPSGGSYRRSVNIERFSYNSDGSMPLIPQTSTGWSGTVNTLRSYNYPTYYVRHAEYDAYIASDVTPVGDQAWQIVPGLADSNAVSIQSVYFPGYYLRHSAFDFALEKNDGSALFAADATFNMVSGLADSSWVSFESYNYPGYYMRHNAFTLYLDTVSTTTDLQDATFIVE